MTVIGEQQLHRSLGQSRGNDRSITSITSGSPSAISNALASRLSNFCPRACTSRSAASWSAVRTASVNSRVRVATTVSVLSCSLMLRRNNNATTGAINTANHAAVTG